LSPIFVVGNTPGPFLKEASYLPYWRYPFNSSHALKKREAYTCFFNEGGHFGVETVAEISHKLSFKFHFMLQIALLAAHDSTWYDIF
jgi:hypothetical protein